jgi:hypothetical protein
MAEEGMGGGDMDGMRGGMMHNQQHPKRQAPEKK